MPDEPARGGWRHAAAEIAALSVGSAQTNITVCLSASAEIGEGRLPRSHARGRRGVRAGQARERRRRLEPPASKSRFIFSGGGVPTFQEAPWPGTEHSIRKRSA